MLNIIRKEKINISLMFLVLFLYILNNYILIPFINYDPIKLFLSSYFDDLISTICFMAYVNFILSFQNKIIIKLKDIIIFCFILGIIWEYITPMYKADSVSDILDIVCYIFGGTIYYIIYNKNKKFNKIRIEY